MATTDQVLAELGALGTAQNRKVYKRHGAGENLFGVSFADLDKVRVWRRPTAASRASSSGQSKKWARW